MDVSFDDYKHDMDELGTSAAGAVAALREKVQDRDRLILWLIQSAGGSIAVPYEVMANLDVRSLEVWDDRQSMSRTFKALPSTNGGE